MDIDSPDKAVEGIMEEDGSSPVKNPDLGLFGNKDDQRCKNFAHENEVPNDGPQVYLDQEYPVSPVMHAGVENEGLQSPIMKSNHGDLLSPAGNHGESFLPIESDLNHNDMERRFFDYGTEEQRFTVEDYQSDDNKDVAEDAGHIAHPGDNDNCHEIMSDDAFNRKIAKSPALDEAGNGGVRYASANFHPEKPVVHAEIDGGSLSPRTEMKEDDYSSVIAASENGGMVWENSSLHSPQRTQNASPSPERQFSISAEGSFHSQQSPHTHPSSRQGGVKSPANIDKKSAPSSTPSRRKRSPSPEKHRGGHKRPSSHDHSSPARRKSPPERTTQRDSHHRDRSPRRHTTSSPRRRDSSWRRGASTSRSPVRRRDSPGRRRDHHRRSRSRSPHARDCNRRPPRRRPSPRRRSPPPSYSRRPSPRRPWSPPANRNTGLGKPGNNLFVAGFSYVTTERDLEKKFSRFGCVTDVRIVRDRRSGESRGFGFLSLERDEDADAAIRAVDQTEWNGRIVLVEKSKTSTH